jgi:hypothetical protein
MAHVSQLAARIAAALKARAGDGPVEVDGLVVAGAERWVEEGVADLVLVRDATLEEIEAALAALFSRDVLQEQIDALDAAVEEGAREAGLAISAPLATRLRRALGTG